MSQYVDTFKIEVLLQRGDVIDQAVTPVARRVGRRRRLTGAPQVQHDQPPHRGQAAEVTEVTLRCREASSHWERIWHRPRNQTATA